LRDEEALLRIIQPRQLVLGELPIGVLCREDVRAGLNPLFDGQGRSSQGLAELRHGLPLGRIRLKRRRSLELPDFVFLPPCGR